MKTIDRQEVQRRLFGDPRVVLIETLPAEEYEGGHLPGAINLPVEEEDFDRRVKRVVPDKSTPVIVYCRNESCGASTEAAERLDALGYRAVYAYEGGKEDWESAGNALQRAAPPRG